MHATETGSPTALQRLPVIVAAVVFAVGNKSGVHSLAFGTWDGQDLLPISSAA